MYAGLGFISHLLNILPAVLSNLAVSLMHVRLSTSVLPQMPPLPSVKSDVFSQTACRCYPTFPKAKRVAPDMSASFSQLSSPLCTLFFFFFFYSFLSDFPSSSSCETDLISLHCLSACFHPSSLSRSFFPPHFLLSALARHYKVSFSLLSFVIFFLPLHSASRLASRCQSVHPPLRLYPSVCIFTSPSSRW